MLKILTENKDKAHECEECHKKFQNHGNLKRHKKIHSRKYLCKFQGCDFNSEIQGILIQHSFDEHLRPNSSENSTENAEEFSQRDRQNYITIHKTFL
ncbi:zinc finger X-chromosomal protein-like [Centruroides sculpturatus]|uniref:zinc finger X-chromosomal protein-like n=1 Tax=Centruroides sculpturatus TaxID=218467 RepID=UPI000C6CE158|nr:zinc finger X-chromosomal protein-like [Centruroides sculpturatus]